MPQSVLLPELYPILRHDDTVACFNPPNMKKPTSGFALDSKQNFLQIYKSNLF